MAELVGIVEISGALITAEFVDVRWDAVDPPGHAGVRVLPLVGLVWRQLDPDHRLINGQSLRSAI